MKQKKRKKWVCFRHRVVRNLLLPVLGTYCRLRFGVKVERFAQQGDRQYLVMMNHQTSADQFFVSMAFRKHVYYIATEDIFSLGWISKVIRYLVAPIPIKKQTTDLQAVKTCIQVAREGGTIALAPEGNRTYSGKTEYIKPSIVKLARALKLPVAIFRIEGGYGVQPRWGDGTRKGRMRAYVSRVIEPEEYGALSDEEFIALIRQELYVNEAVADACYTNGKLAEYLERAMYVCPDCGLTTFESCGDCITCKTCGKQVRYLPSKELEGVAAPFPFRFVNDWYEYQTDFVSKLDLAPFGETAMYRDTARLSQVHLYRHKEVLERETGICLYGDRIEIGENLVMPFEDISAVSVLGRNKLNIYHNGTVYQLKGDKRFNALKYVNIYYHYKNINEGREDGKFLGL
ncbi:MAG: 1-acyl-sn-glycerol-3-phosphate acyltransferase [Ruminococcaceae bacterium]|nr:1-acyl-sn-glycerol-3-phosphate acyltransferase [Oscillospiraceae bacterium]